MSLLTAIASRFRRKEVRPARPKVKASYDAGAWDPDNVEHWSLAQSTSADASMGLDTRKRTRERARYEALQNNSYGKGIIATLAEDTIGTGPRLQMHTENTTANEEVERLWRYWALAMKLGPKLRTMKQSKTTDGEAVAKIVTNERVPHEIKLDLNLVECDRLTAPQFTYDTTTYIDGVTLDDEGNPIAYDILREHPGNLLYSQSSPREFERLEREFVIHWFRRDRAEQHRGISELVSALPLFAFLRRFTLATVAAAESAANMAMLGEGDGAQDEKDYTLQTLDVERNTLTFLPNGYKVSQLRPEHPGTTYPMFKKEILNEVARCVCVPSNVASGDSSGYNYASGRLDHQTYDRSLDVERSSCECEVVDRLFSHWLVDAALTGLLPAAVGAEVLQTYNELGLEAVAMRTPHTWEWDKRPHVDPQKEAQAAAIRVANGLTSRQHEMQEVGLNMDEMDRQAADGFGVSVEEYRAAVGKTVLSGLAPAPEPPMPPGAGPGEEEEEPDDEEAEDEQEEQEEEEEEAVPA